MSEPVSIKNTAFLKPGISSPTRGARTYVPPGPYRSPRWGIPFPCCVWWSIEVAALPKILLVPLLVECLSLFLFVSLLFAVTALFGLSPLKWSLRQWLLEAHSLTKSSNFVSAKIFFFSRQHIILLIFIIFIRIDVSLWQLPPS